MKYNLRKREIYKKYTVHTVQQTKLCLHYRHFDRYCIQQKYLYIEYFFLFSFEYNHIRSNVSMFCQLIYVNIDNKQHSTLP